MFIEMSSDLGDIELTAASDKVELPRTMPRKATGPFAPKSTEDSPIYPYAGPKLRAQQYPDSPSYMPNLPPSQEQYRNMIQSTRPSVLLVTQDPERFDKIVDFCAGCLPGITFLIGFVIYMASGEKKCDKDGIYRESFGSKFLRIFFSILPLGFLILWYNYKMYHMGREHKVGNISVIVYGYYVSAVIIMLCGVGIFLKN